MGLASAWCLRAAGARVLVLERSVPGAEASSAAAGILGATFEAHGPGPMLRLMQAGARCHARWASELGRLTGMDVGYRQDGILQLAFDGKGARKLRSMTRWMHDARLRVESVDRSRMAALEPNLGTSAGGLFFPRDGRIDPPAFFRALHVAAEQSGVTFRSGTYVRRVATDHRRVAGVVLDDGTMLSAGSVVVAAGSWTSLVRGTDLGEHAVIPARGQIVELRCPVPVLGRIVVGPDCYVVPRNDGRSLIGSTLEFVGYRREVTAGAVQRLLAAAIRLVPSLGDASLGSTWSNFRPYTPDGLPLIGQSHTEQLFIASGHYRTGILLAPITGECIAALVAGKRSPVPLRAFSPHRNMPPSMDA